MINGASGGDMTAYMHKHGLGVCVGLSRPFIIVEYLPWETTSRRRPLFLAQSVVAHRTFNCIYSQLSRKTPSGIEKSVR